VAGKRVYSRQGQDGARGASPGPWLAEPYFPSNLSSLYVLPIPNVLS
jgi:hypothetical protein